MVDGAVLFADCPPPECVTAHFVKRADQQIMGLELLSIALGLCTFKAQCEGRIVFVHSDNKGAESAFARGSARCFDHRDIVHDMWLQAVVHNMSLWIVRVSTHLNIADLPSRSDYSALAAISATRCEPVLDEPYLAEAAWALWKRKNALAVSSPGSQGCFS